MGYWKVLLPETATNMCLNPVAGIAGNYTAVGTATIVRQQGSTASNLLTYLGNRYYSMETDADNDGITLTLSALSNAVHYVTVRVRDDSTLPLFPWDWSLDNVNFNVPTKIATEGNWWVYGYQFPAAQANGSTALRIYAASGTINKFTFIGHVQVEASTYPTTPIMGDMRSFAPTGYYWNGLPHASTSTRAANERSGGREYDLETDYNFRVLYGMGAGMPPVTHHVQGMALLPGALYQGHKVRPRVLDLASATKANSFTSVAAARKNFINAMKPDRVSPVQPVVIRHYGNTIKPVEFYGVYDSGMEFNLSGGVVDQPNARFICYDPFAYETHTESQFLTISSSVANADEVIKRLSGVWSNIHTDFANAVRAITVGKNGVIYIGGQFVDVSTVNGDYIVSYDTAISPLSTGTNQFVYALATAANGDIYLGGAFTLAGGIANTARIAKWSALAGVPAFTPLSTGLSGTCWALAFAPDGSLYVGGDFINQGDANGDYIVKWNGAAWSSLGTGMNGLVYAIAVTQNGDVYATGGFTTAGGAAANYIAKWNGSVWSAMGSGLNGDGFVLATDKAGNVYVGGSFTIADGVTCNGIAKWNGRTFEPLGSGLTGGYCYTLAFDENGLLYAGGSFTSAGGLTLADSIAVWNGSTWAHVPANLPGSATVYSILPVKNDLYIGYNTVGAATTSYANTVVNNGSTEAYPRIVINRADNGTTAVIEYLKNETTGDTIWLNYSLLPGETLTIDLTPGERSVKSDMFGDVWRALLRNSDLSTFRLLPGTNSVSAFVNTTGSPTITAYMEWKPTHWAADTVAA